MEADGSGGSGPAHGPQAAIREEQPQLLAPRRGAENSISASPDKTLENNMLFPPLPGCAHAVFTVGERSSVISTVLKPPSRPPSWWGAGGWLEAIVSGTGRLGPLLLLMRMWTSRPRGTGAVGPPCPGLGWALCPQPSPSYLCTGLCREAKDLGGRLHPPVPQPATA